MAFLPSRTWRCNLIVAESKSPEAGSAAEAVIWVAGVRAEAELAATMLRADAGVAPEALPSNRRSADAGADAEGCAEAHTCTCPERGVSPEEVPAAVPVKVASKLVCSFLRKPTSRPVMEDERDHHELVWSPMQQLSGDNTARALMLVYTHMLARCSVARDPHSGVPTFKGLPQFLLVSVGDILPGSPDH